MKEKPRLYNTDYNTGSSDIEGLDSLSDFALDMRCSWNHSADEIWRQLEPDLWASTHNPWVVLQTISQDKFKKIMSDPLFRKKVDSLRQSKEDALTGPASAYTPRIIADVPGVSVPLETALIKWQH